MKAHNHHKGTRKRNVYHGRCHTSKQKNTEKPKRSNKPRYSRQKENGSAAGFKRAVAIHYQHWEKPKLPYEKYPSTKNKSGRSSSTNERSSKIDGSKTSPPRRRGLEGAVIPTKNYIPGCGAA